MAFSVSACLAAGQQLDNQVDVFAVDNDGALNVFWGGAGNWNGPHAISPTGKFLAGAPLAAAKQTDNQLDVFAVDVEGILNVFWVVGAGPTWNSGTIGGNTFDKNTTVHIAAAKQTDNQLDVFAIDKDNVLSVASVADGGSWNGPDKVQVSAGTGIAQGSYVAAAKQTDNQLDLFTIDKNGVLDVFYVQGTGDWQGPIGISNPAITKFEPFDQVAAAKQLDNQLDVFAIDSNGTLTVSWVDDTGSWNPPTTIFTGVRGPLSAAAGIAAAKQLDNQLDVFAIDSKGTLNVSYVIDRGSWKVPPYQVQGWDPAGWGGPAVAKQGDELDVFAFGSNPLTNSTDLNVAWVVGPGSWWSLRYTLP
jgi:hypothetical protein